MRKHFRLFSFLAILALLVGAAPAQAAYAYYRAAVINHSLVGGTNLTNFRLVVDGTFPYLATVPNGGKLTSSSGYDAGWFTSSACTTKLDWKRIIWDATSGRSAFRIRVPSVSASVDTTIYLCYTDASVTTDQSNASGVWPSTAAQFDFGDGSTLDVLDSSGNSNTAVNHSATATTGKVGAGGINIAATGYFTIADSATMQQRSDVTVSSWVYLDPSWSTDGFIFIEGSDTGGGWGFLVQVNTARTILAYFVFSDGSTPNLTSTGTLSTGAWHKVDVVRNGTTISIYIDGAFDSSVGCSSSLIRASSGSYSGIGANTNAGGVATKLNGKLDEFTYDGFAQPSGWITGMYNNENDWSNFIVIGAQVPDSAPRRRILN